MNGCVVFVLCFLWKPAECGFSLLSMVKALCSLFDSLQVSLGLHQRKGKLGQTFVLSPP